MGGSENSKITKKLPKTTDFFLYIKYMISSSLCEIGIVFGQGCLILYKKALFLRKQVVLWVERWLIRVLDSQFKIGRKW